MTLFEDGLRNALEADPALSRKGRRILEILNAPRTARRARRIARMEAHARVFLGKDAPQYSDWSDFDWSSFIGILVRILLALIPFLLL